MPSEPTINPFKLYPAEDFRGRRRVFKTLPSASATVGLTTLSFIVPYRAALIPEQFVAIIPPILALDAESIGNQSPVFLFPEIVI